MGLVGSIKGSMLGIEKSKQMCVCVCVCVRERERERGCKNDKSKDEELFRFSVLVQSEKPKEKTRI